MQSKNYQINDIVLERDEDNLVTVETPPDNDCAYHAVFGEWDSGKRKFICNNVAEKRHFVANKIRACDIHDPLYLLIQDAIKAIIMEGRQIDGKNIKQLKLTYDRFRIDDNRVRKEAWNDFEKVLGEHSSVINYMEDFVKDYWLKKEADSQERIERSENLSTIYQTWVNEDKSAINILSAIPALYEEYKKYNHRCDHSFPWEQFLSDKNLFREYAAFIEKKGVWLTANEIGILAYAYNIKVNYYIPNKISRLKQIEIYNENGEVTVDVEFNGINHYERVITQEERDHYIALSEADEMNNDLFLAFNLSNSLDSSPDINDKPPVKSSEWTDFPALARTINEIELKHQGIMRVNAEIKEKANHRLEALRLFSDKNWREQATENISKEIKDLNEKLLVEENNLTQSKERTALLQRKLDNLTEERASLNLEGEVDEKVDWIITRKALQELQAENKAMATERKGPLQQATLMGQVKVEEELENRLKTVIKDMEEECNKLEEKQALRHLEKEAIMEARRNNQIALENSIQNEKEKQTSHDDSEKKLKAFKEHIQIKTKEYESTLADLNKSLDNAQRQLQTETVVRDNLAAEARQITLRIQYLEGRTTKVIQVDNWVRENHKTWHGHIWGWRDNWVNVNRPVPKTVEDTAVTGELAQKRNQLSSHQAQLIVKERVINVKNDEIAQFKKNLEKLAVDWKETKSKLNNENWQLEDALKIALGHLKDAEAYRKQKENEEAHLKESLLRKESEIAHEQEIINGRKKTLHIFYLDLNACFAKIRAIKNEGELVNQAINSLAPTQVVNLDVETNSHILQASLRIEAKKSLDLARNEEMQFEETVIKLKNKLEEDKKYHYELSHPDDKAVASKRQDEELNYLHQIEEIDRNSRRAQEIQAEVLQIFLLGQGILLTGYAPSTNVIDNVIVCLLQGIFESYPTYQLNSTVNTPQPETWQNHLTKMKEKLLQKGIDQCDEITIETLTHIVNIVNEEYQNDDITLQVSLFGRPLETCPIKANQTISLNLWQNGHQFLTLLPEDYQHKQGVYGRAHRLTSTLLSSPQFFQALCEEVILRDCKSSLTKCAPEVLANYCREELQQDKNAAKNENANETHFHAWFKKYFANIDKTSNESSDHRSIYLQTGQYCLTKLNEICHLLTKEQQEEIYQCCRQQYLTELKSCIMGEIKKRAENKSETKRLLDESKADLVNKMQAIEKEIKTQEEIIANLAREIKEKEIELDKRKEQSVQLQQHYENQSEEIEAEIKHFIAAKSEIEKKLELLIQDTSANQKLIQEFNELKEDMKSRLEKLQAEKSEINQKLDEARKFQLELQSERIKLESDRQKFAEIRKKSEASKALEDRKIKFLETWQQFLKGVHENVLHDRKAFENRRVHLEQFKNCFSSEADNSILMAYQYLVNNIDSLKKFNTQEIKNCIEQSLQEDYRMLASNWPNDLKIVLDDVLGSPSISSEIVSPITIKGNNISWSQVIQELEEKLEKRLNYYGLGFKNHKLVVVNPALIGIINELPEGLKKLFKQHIELHCQHYTLIKENNVIQTPRWHELEEFVSHNEITSIISKANIDFTEVLRAFADSIEIVAAHHLYLDEDVCLPGIHLTLFSKEKIHCKENILVKTTAKQFMEIQVSKAKDGHVYQAESGREGDDGLDGPEGNCGGHIVIKAEDEIENLNSIRCESNGSNGLNGQRAGDGSKGHRGVDMPDADSDDTNRFGKAQFIVAWGRVPGMDEHGNFSRKNEFSGPGGNAGLAGLGGLGGLPGSIVIVDKENELKLLPNGEHVVNGKAVSEIESQIKQEQGIDGGHAKRDAKGGNPGEAGGSGVDHFRNKKGFFSSTKTEKGQYSDRAYDHPGEFVKSDNAWGINVNVFGDFCGNNVKQSGYTNNRYRQIKVYGASARIGLEKSEGEYRQHPRRDKRSLGMPGKNNSEEGRQKSIHSQRRSQHSQTMQHQLAQLTRINQIATNIQNNHAWLQFDNDYKAEIAEYRKRSEHLAEEIAECHSQEVECAKQSANVTEQLQQVTETIEQLDNQLSSINQLQNQLHNKLNANDLSQLQNIKRLAEQGSTQIEMQAELACANIDINSEKKLQVQFDQLHKTVQSALNLCQTKLTQDITSLKENTLLQADRLALLQSEYNRLAEKYGKQSAEHTQENKLQALVNELATLKQTKEVSEINEQATILMDGVEVGKSSDENDSDFTLKKIDNENFIFKMPTPQEQSEKILSAIDRMFGKDSFYQELKNELKESKTEKIWITTFKGLCHELKKQRDYEWMEKHINDWRRLLKYCENIIKVTPCTLRDLNELYRNIQVLVMQLAKVDNEQQGKCLLALENISNTIEERYIEILSEQCVQKSMEGKERETHRELLINAFKKVIHAHCHTNPPMTLFRKLQIKKNLFDAISAFLAVKSVDKLHQPFAVLILHLLKNSSKTHFSAKDKLQNKTEIVVLFQLFSNLGGILNIKENYPSLGHTISREKMTENLNMVNFEILQFETSYLYLKTIAAIEHCLEIKTSDRNENTKKQSAYKEIKTCEEKILAILNALNSAENPLAKKLFHEVVNKYQNLLVIRYQILFENSDVSKPAAYCHLLKELYLQAKRFNKKKSDQQDLSQFAEETVRKLMQSIEVPSELWLAILKDKQNLSTLKMDQGFIYLTLFQQIVKSAQVDLALEAYEVCKSIAIKDPVFQEQVKKEMRDFCHSALEREISSLAKKLEFKKKDDAALTHVVNEILQVLFQLSALWLSPHCLLSLGEKFTLIPLLQKIEASPENLLELRDALHQHLEKQKEKLLYVGSKKQDKKSMNFAERLTLPILKIEECFQKIDKLTKLDEAPLKDLDKCYFTLQLILKNSSDLLTSQDYALIERSYFKLKQILIHFYPTEQKDEKQIKLWSDVNRKAQLLENIINSYYFTLMVDQFSNIKQERNKQRDKIALLKKEILDHYDRILKNETTKRYPIAHQKFIQFLIEKAEHLCLSHYQTSDSINKTITDLEQIRTSIVAANNIQQIEQCLINEVNNKGILLLKNKQLFANMVCSDNLLSQKLSILSNELNNNNPEKILSAWNQASLAVLSVINRTEDKESFFSDQSWFNQFITDSNLLFQTLVTENEEQENSVEDKEVSLQAWLQRVSTLVSTQKTSQLRQLIQALRLATPHTNHYVYASRLLEQAQNTHMAKEVDKKWDNFSSNTLQAMQNIFSLINIDLASTHSKNDFYHELSALIKPVYNLSIYEQQSQAVERFLKRINNEMCALDASSEKEKTAQKTDDALSESIKHLLNVNFTKPLSVAKLRKILLNVKQLNKNELNELTSFIKQWLIAEANATLSKNSEKVFYQRLITTHLANLYREKYLEIKSDNHEEVAIINYVDTMNHINNKPEISLAIYASLHQSADQENQSDITILNDLLKSSFKYPQDVLSHLEEALLRKDLTWQIPYLIGTIPLIFSADFFKNKEVEKDKKTEKEKWEEMLDALLKSGPAAEIKERKNVQQDVQKHLYDGAKEKYLKNGSLCIDYAMRMQLLQVMLAVYINRYVLKELSKDHVSREVITRIVHCIDKIIAERIPENNNLSKQKEKLEEIGHYYHLIQKLLTQPVDEILTKPIAKNYKPTIFTTTSQTNAKQPNSVLTLGSKISVKKLLTPIEGKLFKYISHEKPDAISEKSLLKSPPHQWENILRKRYFDTICFAYLDSEVNKEEKSDSFEFYDLFMNAYIAAQRNEGMKIQAKIPQVNNKNTLEMASKRFMNEQIWLTIVDYLLTMVKKGDIQLKDVCLILKSVIATGTFDHLSSMLASKEHPIARLKECLFNECNYAIKCAVKDVKQQDEALKKLSSIKHEIFNENEGHVFLQKLSHALLKYRKKHKGYIYHDYLDELLALVIETKAYRYPQLFNENNLLQWCYQLKKEKYIQLFNLHEHRSSKETNSLVYHLNQLEKDKPQLISRLITLLQKSIREFQRISVLNEFLSNFVRKYWDLDEDILNDLETKPVVEWDAYLNEKAAAHFSQKASELPDRTAKDVVHEMRKEIDGINKPIRDLLNGTESSTSYIEQTIAEIKLKYESEIIHWDEAQIRNWVANFNKRGAQLLNEHRYVVELVSILMRASSLKTNKVPRPTQLTALLLYINAIQNGKGRLGNISTGEGKSLITTMVAIVHGLRNERVDIVTSNEVLAERDAKSNESLFELFDIRVSNNCDAECEKNENLRKERYTTCQVMYGIPGSFQRDALLTNFFGKPIRGQQGNAVQGNALVIDEVDSMFIDNAEKILYISHSIQDLRYLNDLFIAIWAAVNSAERDQKNEHNINAVVTFIRKQLLEENVAIPNILKTFVERRLKIWVENAYLAKQMTEGKEYIIPRQGEKHGEIVIMDLDTGVEQMTTQWSYGLHQFTQLKKSKKLSVESLKAVFMSNAVFFQSYNGHITGMTGTLGSNVEMDLMAELYGIDYFRLPRNKPERYIQEESILVGSRLELKEAMVEYIKNIQAVKRNQDEKDIKKAEQTLIELDERLEYLVNEKVRIEDNIFKEVENEKVIKGNIDALSKQLARDVEIKDNIDGTNKLPSREVIILQKQLKEEMLKDCQTRLAGYRKKLEKITAGENGIVPTNNDKNNAKSILSNTGARPILLICPNVNDVEYFHRAVQSDEKLSKCNIIILKSKNDKVPQEKIGPNVIIIATNIAGRGTDIETLPIVEENGGLLVVQSTVPPNIRIETQAFYRTARNGNRGSGKFIVCDSKLRDNPHLTVDMLREMRDIEEARRLDKIRTQGIPKLHREQKLFAKFIELQKRVREKLDSDIKNPKEIEVKYIETQIKSLQNKWAFFLDELEEKIADIDGISEDKLILEFAKFEESIWRSLSNHPFCLITEPAERRKMARYYMDKEIDKDCSDETAYRLAEEYLDTNIEKEEKFSEFDRYYKALCNFGQKKNSIEHKASARHSLKKAIDLFEEKIGKLSTAAQFIRVLRTRQQEKEGTGLEVDDFTRSISNEMSLIQVHINAAREALGTSLAPDNFKSGTVTGNENEIVFNNLRQHLKQIIKDYRLSKKVSVQLSEKYNEEAIFHRGHLIELPPMSSASRKKIVSIVKNAVSSDLNQRERINPSLLKELFITKAQFLQGLGENRYKKERLISLHPDATINAKGKWDTGPFSDCQDEVSHKIKQAILNLNKAVTENELVAMLKEMDLSEEKSKAMIKYLSDDKSILRSNEVYLLREETRSIIKEYLEKIILHNQPIDISSLNLSKFPEFRDCEEKLREALKSGTILTREQLNISERAFNLLFQLLKDKKYFKTSLIERLELNSAFNNEAQHQDVENELLRIYESNLSGASCELLLCDDASERRNALWSYLKSMKVVKDPNVKFKLNRNPNDLLDDIKKIIKNNINTLIPNKSEEERDKYVDSIYSALEKSIGKIKQFENLKIDPKTLQDFLQGGKLPPEAIDFTHQCCDIVLSLAEDRGWDWGVFAVALIGIIQIAAGVLIGALTFGAAAFISAVLISEGIGDLVFAVQSGISGNFSWSAYGDRKWQSLLISVATAGIGVGIGAIATGASAATTSVNALVQKFVLQLAEAGLTCALSLATDQLIKQVISLLLNELDGEFEKWVRHSASYQITEKRLETLIGNLYDRFGAVEAGRIVADIMRDNIQERHANFINIFSQKLQETMKKLSSQLSIAANQLERSGNSTAALIGKIAKIAGQVATATEIINKFRDIASLVPESFGSFEKSLERAMQKTAPGQEEVLRANQSLSKEKFCEDILKQQTTVVITEIKNFLKNAVIQPGTQALLQMAVQPVKDFLNNELLESLKKAHDEIPHAENLADDISTLMDMKAPAGEDDFEADQDVGPNRSPAGEVSQPHPKEVHHKAKTFAEKTQAESQQPFSFSLRNQKPNWSLMNAEPEKHRFWDAVGCASGLLQIGSGVALTASGGGAPLGIAAILMGIDNANANCTNFLTGQHQSTYLHRGLVDVGEKTGWFGEQGATYLELALNAAPDAFSLLKAGASFVKGSSSYANKFSLFSDATPKQLPSQSAVAETLVGTSVTQMRREAQNVIANDPDHLLKFLLNDEGRFFRTRGLSHAELIDDPRLIQMGHKVSRVSGEPEKIILQGAWENQFNAVTIERSSIGGYVNNAAIDIGGVAVDLPTAMSWERYGLIPEGTISSSRIVP